MKQLRGVIICGGESRRMGTDKGLIRIGDSCWAAYMADKLNVFGLPVLVSINKTQQLTYLNFFSGDQLIVDSMDIGGPLNGLLSVHTLYPDEDLLLLACDMINMQKSTIERLINTYNDDAGHDFYAYRQDAFAEPLCAIYTGRGLKKLIREQGTLSLQKWSLQKVLMPAITKNLTITEPGSFENHNNL
ncbi:molybdenum cofactor guanylyltransferase [Mucilaginibacter sp. PPCGB 2223]|uniref:molybdenum cofactor guanylyltransferase n=1 Tax=Mucilaginibacter sp. PPCGB 2223 TaxID=1886027 RepID=UPI001585FB42|nr:molybdenum cofactor guanylyltransferase [Mucilaginibacter sp. PPCGB 2223]